MQTHSVPRGLKSSPAGDKTRPPSLPFMQPLSVSDWWRGWCQPWREVKSGASSVNRRDHTACVFNLRRYTSVRVTRWGCRPPIEHKAALLAPSLKCRVSAVIKERGANLGFSALAVIKAPRRWAQHWKLVMDDAWKRLTTKTEPVWLSVKRRAWCVKLV